MGAGGWGRGRGWSPTAYSGTDFCEAKMQKTIGLGPLDSQILNIHLLLPVRKGTTCVGKSTANDAFTAVVHAL